MLTLACQTSSMDTRQTVHWEIDVLQHRKAETGLRSWCHQASSNAKRSPGAYCVDGLIGTETWPDEAIVCLDQIRVGSCLRLGDLRGWVEAYQQRIPAT